MSALTEPIEFGDNPTAVYRLYDAEDVLLYVGITGDPGLRMHRHSCEQSWWPDVARRTMVWYATREEASEVETAAIEAEKPKHNKVRNTTPGTPQRGYRPPTVGSLEATWKAGDWVDLGSTRMRQWGRGHMPA